MRQVFIALWFGCAVLVHSTALAARAVFIDPAAANGPASWNNINFYTADASVDLKDSLAAATGIRLTVTKALQASNTNGSPAPYGDAAEFAPAGANNAYGTYPAYPYGAVVFSNLSLSTPYTFTFYASRTGISDNRETLYTLTGSEVVATTLDAANNSNRVAYVRDLFPAPDGTISLRFDLGSNNTDSGKHYYVSAIKLTFEQTFTDISARGSTLVSNATSMVRINSEGSSGPIALSDPTTVVQSLLQNTATDATVDTAGKTLKVSWASIGADKASLTVGAASSDGTLAASSPGGQLQLHNQSSNALTVRAVIADNTQPSTLVKSGEGPVVLAGANTFSGVLSIPQAPLVLAHPLALQSVSLGVTGTVFDASVAAHTFTLGGLTNAFGLSLADNAANPVSLSVGNNQANSIYSGILSGPGDLRKIGSGTLTLSGANIHSGGTLVQQGQLTASHTNALGTGPVVNDSLLDLTVGSGAYSGLSLSLAGTGTVNVTLGSTSGTTYLDGDYSAFTGTWNLGKGAGGKARMNGPDNAAATLNVRSNATVWIDNGSTHEASLFLYGGNCGESYGQLRLQGNATWSGPVYLANDITDSNDGFFGGPSATTTGYVSGVISDINGPHPVQRVGSSSRTYLTCPSNTFGGPLTIRSGTLGGVTLRNVGQPSSFGQPADAVAGTIKMGTARLTYLGTGDTTDRIIDLISATGTCYLEQNGSGPLTMTGDLTISGVGGKTLQLEGSGTGEFGGYITNGVGSTISVVKAASGTWTLSNDNRYSGGTTINNGTLIASGSGSLGTGAITVNGSTLVAKRGDALGSSPLTLAANGILELAHDGAAETPNPITIGVGNNGSLLAGVASGDTAVNHRVGDLFISLATCTVSRASSVLNGTPVVTLKNLFLSGGGSHTSTLRPVDASIFVDGATFVSANAFNKTIRLDGTSSGNRVNGPITNGISGSTVALIKDNSSTWTLAGTNAYSGSTIVSGGTLILAGQHTGAGTTTVGTNALFVIAGAHSGTGTVAVSGGTLEINGADGALTAASDVAVSLNGTLTITNNAGALSASRFGDTTSLTLSGGTLRYVHPADGSSYAETAGALTIAADGNSVAVSQAAAGQTSALTFAALSRTAGTVDFAGASLGADARNQVLFSAPPALPNGIIGPWATVNGSDLAAYGAFGVVAYSGYTDLFAKGPSTLADDASVNARINAEGSGGDIDLAASVTRVNTLSQNTLFPSTVKTAGKTLRASGVRINPGQAALTLGATAEDGTLTALTDGGDLLFANSGTGSLTVNAALADNGTASSLSKFGPGPVVLAGAVSHTGPTLVNEGDLSFASAQPQVLAGVVSGSGSITKNGTNLLHLLAANTFTGPTYINNGIVRANQNTAFGAPGGGGLFIASGATLDVGCTPDVGGTRASNGLDLGSKTVTIQGPGYAGQGAILNSSTGQQQNAVERLVLADDARIGGVTRWDVRGGSTLLNSHTLTKVGNSSIVMVDNAVTPADGHIDVSSGILRFEAGTKLNGSSANTLTVRSGAEIELYRLSNPQPWTLNLEDGAIFDAANSSTSASHNRWSGPVTVGGAVTLTGGSAFVATIQGEISGSGPITETGSGTIALTGTNTFAGPLLLTGGILSVPRINPVGEAGPLGLQTTAADAAIKLSGGALAYTGEGETPDRALELYGTGSGTLIHNGTGPLLITNALAVTATGNKTLTLRGTAKDGSFSGSITNGTSAVISVTKSDTGAWLLSGNNTFSGTLAVNMGTLAIAGTNAQGAGAISIANAANSNAIMRITEGATVSGTGAFRIGYNSGSAGALYLTGGVISRSAGNSDDSLGIGVINNNNYGYFFMSGGAYTNSGRMNMAGSDVRVCTGLARITGGTMQIGEYILIGRTNGCYAVLTVEGGSITRAGATANISLAHRGGRSELNITGGLLDNSGLSVSIRQGAIREATGVVNICKGTLAANMVTNYGATGWVNFNGGTLKAGANTTSFLSTSLTRATVNGPYGDFAGGAVIDSAGKNVTIGAPLQAPTGDGIFGIALADPGSGYVGEPYVMIEGGGGEGATAVANMEDDGTGNGTYRVASVTITNPGWGYTSDPVVTFYKGGTANSGTVAATAASVTRAPTASGGLTKTGAGILTLTGASTFTGMTTISNGTLRLGAANALPPNAPVTLAGGTYDLGGFTVTNQLTYISGAITNGVFRMDLSPAGTGTIGTQNLTMQAGSSIQGSYYANVAADGSSDLVAVTGSINLAGLSLQLVNPENLDSRKTYTLMTVSGTRTGTFASTNLPSRWHALYQTDGTVKLICVNGTLMTLL